MTGNTWDTIKTQTKTNELLMGNRKDHIRVRRQRQRKTKSDTPIEHNIWDALDRRIRQRVPVPANIQQLCTAIEEEWTNIPQTTINNLINSMRRRCVALCEANGGHTRY